MSWLCLLHNTPDAKEQWRQTPVAAARQHLEKFEYSSLMTFFIAFLLTTVASAFKGKKSSCPDPKLAEQYRLQSLQFFHAANEFHCWQDLLNEDDKLKTRIEAATPLGRPQKLAKTPPKNRNLNPESRTNPAKVPEQQPWSGQSHAPETVERMEVDVVDHTTSNADNENSRAERPERYSNTTVV